MMLFFDTPSPMNLSAPRLPLLAIPLAVAACSSQIDSIPTPTVATTDVSPGGIYIGQDSTQIGTTAAQVIALVDENQDIDLYAADGSSLLSGLYKTTSTFGFSAQARYFPLTGSAAGTVLTETQTGTYASESQILVTYLRSPDGVSGTYNLAYEPTLYQVPSTLVALSGVWVVQDSFGAIVNSFEITKGGAVTGSTNTPLCTYTGQAAILDLRFNVYSLNLSESCTVTTTTGPMTVNTSLNGLAALLPASSVLGNSQSELVLTGASATEARLFLLNPPT